KRRRWINWKSFGRKLSAQPKAGSADVPSALSAEREQILAMTAMRSLRVRELSELRSLCGRVVRAPSFTASQSSIRILHDVVRLRHYDYCLHHRSLVP